MNQIHLRCLGLCSESTNAITATGAADPLAVFRVRVFRCELVTVDTVVRSDAKGDAAPTVLLVRYGLKVFGIAARPVPAQMIDVQSCRDWAHEQLIGETMGVGIVTIDPTRERAVSAWRLIPEPYPTAILALLNTAKESRRQRSSSWVQAHDAISCGCSTPRSKS